MFIWSGLSGSILIILASFLRGTKDKYSDVCHAAGMLCFCLIPLIPGRLISILYPRTLDWYLYRADLALGIDVLPAAQYAWSEPWVSTLLSAVYVSLPFVMAVCWVAEKSVTMRHSILIAAVAGFACYVLVPACGPQYAFSGFPWSDIHGSGLTAIDAIHPRNCFPSLHFSWSLLLLTNAKSKWLRVPLYLYVSLMAFSTTLGGEHYVVDLIAAIPFSIAVQYASERISSTADTSSSIPLVPEVQPCTYRLG